MLTVTINSPKLTIKKYDMYVILCIIAGLRFFLYELYMNQIDYCKIGDSFSHYHNSHDYYYIYTFFIMYGSACGCVRQ